MHNDIDNYLISRQKSDLFKQEHIIETCEMYGDINNETVKEREQAEKRIVQIQGLLKLKEKTR